MGGGFTGGATNKKKTVKPEVGNKGKGGKKKQKRSLRRERGTGEIPLLKRGKKKEVNRRGGTGGTGVKKGRGRDKWTGEKSGQIKKKIGKKVNRMRTKRKKSMEPVAEKDKSKRQKEVATCWWH